MTLLFPGSHLPGETYEVVKKKAVRVGHDIAQRFKGERRLRFVLADTRLTRAWEDVTVMEAREIAYMGHEEGMVPFVVWHPARGKYQNLG